VGPAIHCRVVTLLLPCLCCSFICHAGCCCRGCALLPAFRACVGCGQEGLNWPACRGGTDIGAWLASTAVAVHALWDACIELRHRAMVWGRAFTCQARNCCTQHHARTTMHARCKPSASSR
jgi:hypothetical protein